MMLDQGQVNCGLIVGRPECPQKAHRTGFQRCEGPSTEVQRGEITYFRTHKPGMQKPNENSSHLTAQLSFCYKILCWDLLAKVSRSLCVPVQSPLFFDSPCNHSSMWPAPEEWVNSAETNEPGVKCVDTTEKLTRNPSTQ